MNSRSFFWNSVSCLFGVAVLAAGLVNIFWGNDPFFGVFIALLSLVFFPPVTAFAGRLLRVNIPWYAKVVLGLLIVWVVLGVGELFSKIAMMRSAL